MGDASKNERAYRNTFHRLVNNKNNLEELFLRRLLASYRREVTGLVSQIEQERLDWMQFFKRVKTCDSDNMAEFEAIHKSLRENPPSPIEVPPITERVQLPPLPVPIHSRNASRLSSNSISTLRDGGGASFISARLVTTAPGKRKTPTPSKEQPQLLRSKTDLQRQGIPKLDLSLSESTTRKYSRIKSAGQRSITGDEMRDVLTSLPTIDTGRRGKYLTSGSHTDRPSENSRKPEADNNNANSSNRMSPNLRKSISEIQLSGSPAKKPRPKKRMSSLSDIPDDVVREARDTVISIASLDSDLESVDEAFTENHHHHHRDRRRHAKMADAREDDVKLQSKLGSFYQNLDEFAEEHNKRQFPDMRRSSILIDLGNEMLATVNNQDQSQQQNTQQVAAKRKQSFSQIFL